MSLNDPETKSISLQINELLVGPSDHRWPQKRDAIESIVLSLTANPSQDLSVLRDWLKQEYDVDNAFIYSAMNYFFAFGSRSDEN